jgi:hypothetical protein
MIDMALVVLQDLTGFEEVPGSDSEVCVASSHDVYQASSIKVEKSDTEDEKDPGPVTFPAVKAEPEVSCVHIRRILQILVSLLLLTFATVNNLHL